MGVAGNIREPALEISPATHRRIGRSPEKPQIFLYLFVVVYSRIKENTLQVTPTAKRNSYRVAILVGRLPRVACFARNPGLGKRNSYRVAAGMDLLCLGDDAHKIRPIAQPHIHHNYQPQTNRKPHIHHKHQPQTNHPTPHPSQASTTNQSPAPTSITSINP